MTNEPSFAGALSTAPDTDAAIRDVVRDCAAQLGGVRPDLALVFVTHHHGAGLDELGQRLAQSTGARALIGCTGENVIAPTREVEGEPALVLWAAALPDTEVRFFEVHATPGPGDEAQFHGGPTIKDPAQAGVILLAEPYRFPADVYLELLNDRHPGVPVIGGMASGGMGPGQNLLVTHKGLREAGAVGVVLEGAVEIRAVVSQGCRPVGQPWVVTACSQNLVQKLGGRPALDVLMETLANLPAADQKLFQRGPFAGLAIDPAKSVFGRGDFVARGIVGIHQAERAIAVGDTTRRGQTLQFLVRDVASAGEDLSLLLGAVKDDALGTEARSRRAGALLFSCNGRGSRWFGRPDHDLSCVRGALSSELPVAGFFAAGEIGPVGGRNFLHGFTASVAVLRRRR
jgi:small ligand-binding sensory domain FIST